MREDTRGNDTGLPTISPCVARPAEPVSVLGDHAVFRVLVAFAVVAVLGIGQLYLQFALQDAKVEFVALQEKHRELSCRTSAIRHDIESMCDAGRLRSIALTRLGMREPEASALTYARIPQALVTKYAGKVGGHEGHVPNAPDPLSLAGRAMAHEQPAAPERLLLTIMDMNKAFGQSE